MIEEQSGSAPPTDDANATANADAGKNTTGDDAASDASKNADKDAADKKKGAKPDGVTPEIQAYIDSQAAAARRAGETKGKQTKEEEIEAAKVEAAKAAALEAGQHRELYETEQKEHLATKAKLTVSDGELNKLRAALAGQVPNPLENYKRIVGDDYDAMIEDAKQLAASFGGNAHRDEQNPPIVPNAPDGGKFEQNKSKDDKTTTTDLDRNRSKYNVL